MNKKEYLISVIIPTYNSERTIQNVINSVLNQTYKNIELIIINDGSTDNTLENLKKIQDSRVIVLNEEKSGPSTARNLGINTAKGDFILFADSDDKLDENIINEFVKIIEKRYYDVVLFKTIRLGNGGKIIKTPDVESFNIEPDEVAGLIKSIYNKFYKYNEIFGFDAPWGKFISRKLILDNKIYFPEGIYRFEDSAFCRKIYECTDNIYYLNKLGYYYFRNEQSLCNRYHENTINIYYDALTVLGDNLYNDNNFYIKCITTLTECEKSYFFNKQYNKKYKQLKREYLEMLDREYYKKAIERIDVSTIPIYYKLEIKLLKRRMFFIYMILKKIYMRYKKEI